jgi:RNA polymerase sigma factor (sigma-70 family)
LGANLEEDNAPSLDEWFSAHVLPLDAPLTAYLRRACRDKDSIEDIRQEVYVRTYDAARHRRPPNVAAFMFTVARNLIIDQARRSRVVPMDLVADISDLAKAPDDIAADQLLIVREEFALFRRAFEQLPSRCREVIALRKIEGLSQRETAARMKISEDTVERQMLIGMRRLVDAMAAFCGDSLWFRNRSRRKSSRVS